MTNCIKPNDFKPNGIKPSDHLPYIPILLSEVEQEQRPSGNGDREAIVVGAGLFDGEGERAYIAYAPHYIFAFRTHILNIFQNTQSEKGSPGRSRCLDRLIARARADVATGKFSFAIVDSAIVPADSNTFFLPLA